MYFRKITDKSVHLEALHCHLGKGIYELVNEKGKILKKKVNINRLKLFKCQLPQSDPDQPYKDDKDLFPVGSLQNPNAIATGTDITEYLMYKQMRLYRFSILVATTG